MIFVTVGSQKFQFNRLLMKLDELIQTGVIQDEVFAQIGVSDYKPQYYNYTEFLGREEFKEKTEACQLFLTHGGTGAIIGAVKEGKKVIAVPRLKKFGEHVDDHQMQLLKQFEEMDIIEVCWELDRLGDVIKKASQTEYQCYKSNTDKIVENIERFLKTRE